MIIIVLVTVGVCVGGFFLVADQIFSNAVPRATLLGFSPDESPQRAEIETQTEPHTCGLHSLRSVYRAYGLNPDEHALRVRLGVDVPANPADETSTGTLQPDLTRVLAQDGFSMETLDLEDSTASTQLESRLSKQHKALALIRKLDNGNLHWVVLQQADSPESLGSPADSTNDIEHIEVIDSLAEQPRQENTRDFIQRQAVTIILLGFEQNVDQASVKAGHRLGVVEMKKTPGRVKQLQ